MELLSLFSKFHLVTRCGPAFVCVFPLVEMCVINFLRNGKIPETIFVIVALLALMILSMIVRDLGKREEKRIVRDLGGYPTTISLRLRDARLNKISKARYHRVLRDVWGLELPKSLRDENKNPEKSDSQYDAAVDKLRVYANFKQAEFPLVEKSLEMYNFWRNLYGSRWLFYVATFVALICVVGANYAHFCGIDWGLLVLLLSQLCLFYKYVTKSHVIEHAFNYATTLLEVLEIDNSY